MIIGIMRPCEVYTGECAWRLVVTLVSLLILLAARPAYAQKLGEADRGEPGDSMIQAYLARETQRLAEQFSADIDSLEAWQTHRPRYKKELLYSLGLDPLPEKTPLNATVTGKYEGDGYVVELLHYQSRPGLYVTGNLYRPANVGEGERLPAVFYVCGHSGRGRNGNKTAFQSHGIWFARHGYVCLIVDTLQLGEIAATHHGTYNLNRWWWHSRGYTPAGVEAWNGIRGIDYLISRPDVDPERIAVTGISGGGAATFWIAAADERVAVAVPISGMADLESYVTNRVINGHCDCMFCYNTYRWPWTRIAGLVAPRPLLFVNSDQDAIFPMDANERISNRLERLYSLYGASDRFDTVVSVGGHAYRKDIRQAVYRFLNTYLKNDPSPVLDSEVDVVAEDGDPGPPPIPYERLRVFPTDADLPADELNTRIDEHFVPLATVDAPAAGEFEVWTDEQTSTLRRVTFGYFPKVIPAGKPLRNVAPNAECIETEEGIEVYLRYPDGVPAGGDSLLLVVVGADETESVPRWISDVKSSNQKVVLCEIRGVGATRWTRNNPPNYVERSHALLGRTVDTGRIWDVIAAAKYLAGKSHQEAAAIRVGVAGRGPAGILAAYAAVLEPAIEAVHLLDPPTSHRDAEAPPLLNVLRVTDIPAALGLLAPRPLRIRTTAAEPFALTREIYEAAGAGSSVSLH